MSDRTSTISRAIELIDTASTPDLARYLTETDIHDHLKRDPARLREHLAGSAAGDTNFGAWKASQQLLRAAGLPY